MGYNGSFSACWRMNRSHEGHEEHGFDCRRQIRRTHSMQLKHEVVIQ